MAANHNAQVIMTALMTTVAKPLSVYVSANLVHAASMPIVMLAITAQSVDAPVDTKDNPKAVAQRLLHQYVILPHVSLLIPASPTHVVQMLNAVLVVRDPSVPAPLVMKEIHLLTAGVENVLRPMIAHLT